MFDTQMVFQSFFFLSKNSLKMLSRPQNIRVDRIDNFFLSNMFTEETGFF